MNSNTREKFIKLLDWFEIQNTNSDEMKRLIIELVDALDSDETIS